MSFVLATKEKGMATITLRRGKVNALNEPMVSCLGIHAFDISFFTLFK